MSADIPSTPPAEMRAGDTIRWRRSLSDYPADDGWELKYTLLGQGGAHNGTASTDGDAHQFTVAASASADWAAGNYLLTEYVTKGDERYTIASRSVRVLPDLASATGPVDTRSHARKVLDAIEAWLESKAPVAGMLEIAGRRIQHYPIEQLLALRDRYRNEVAAEEAAARGGRRGQVQVRL